MTRPSRRLTATLLALWACFIMACSCCGCPTPEKTQEQLTEANALWDSGKKVDAVSRYKALYTDYYITNAMREQFLSRIIDTDAEAGRTDAAKKWVRAGLRDKVKIACSNPAAKALVEEIEKEHAEEERRKEEEAKKKQEEANQKQEEARRREAEREAQRRRDEQLDRERPQPSRANYNKVRLGMSLDEVQAILGRGKESASGPGVLIVTWQSDSFLPTVISVTFQNNQVQAKAIAP